MEVQDPRAGETSLAELTGIQFGILSNDDTLALSVFEKNQSIDKAKDLWDSRLGVYNLLGKDNRCCTCGAKKPSDCDGHFGHINFPMAIYNPLHIRYLKKVLSQICLVCHRYKEKKGKKVTSTAEEEAVAQELRELVRDVNSSVMHCDTDVTQKPSHFKSPGRNGAEVLSSKGSLTQSKWMCDAEILTSLNGSSKYKVDMLAALKAQITHGTGLARKIHPSMTPTLYNAESEPTKVKVCRKPTHGTYKPESRNEATKTHSRLEAAYMASKGQPLPLIDLSSDDDSPLAFQRTALKVNSSEQVRCSLKTSYGGHASDDSDSSESSDSGDECKYCGAHVKNKEDRYPNLVVTLTKKNENSYETIEMKACAKDELVPLDYWDFVQGHPGGCKSTRLLMPFESGCLCERCRGLVKFDEEFNKFLAFTLKKGYNEHETREYDFTQLIIIGDQALQILQCLSGEVIKKLGMHELVARPEALVLCTLPVPPSGARINEKDSSSFLTRPQMDQQHMLLQRLAVEVKRLQSSRTGKPNFATAKSEVMELQSLTSHYLTGSKWERGLKWKAMDPEVQKEDKFMKGHVLAKVNNVSARLVVFGDPSIKIEEISVPIDLVEHLTIPEKVTALSIHRLQEYVNNGPYADFFKTGAVRHDRPGRLGMSLYKRAKRNMTLVIGDTVHRHLKDGDLVIVNRPPSLTKHSLMAMRVRLHLGCGVAINPLICAPFQADFDGDTLHIFVPQSPEVLAEAHELLNIPNQIINPQGGQSNAALTEDSRLGAYLLTSSLVFLDKAEMCHFTMAVHLASLPVPAILKSSKGKGPLWTGQQLYSMTIPKGTQYSAPDRRFTSDAKKGILIRDGELLVCSKSSYWLEDAQGALAVVISRSLGPVAALTYLNHAQELANLYLSYRGFSVGLQDYLLTRDTHSRSKMVNRVRDDLARANREALLKTLIVDEEVQKKEVDMHPTSILGFSTHMDCGRSKGLYLSNAGSFREVGALDKVAISAFQTRFSQAIENLARDYCSQDNSLLVMIRAGSKGSMTKLVQQTVSLGIQLFKGEHLLPCSAQSLACQGNLRNLSNARVTDLLQMEQGTPVGSLPGFWESRGIISNSYLDGLRPLQFFTHNIASRYGLQRAGVEQPNLLLKRLLLFLRDLHVRYDGSVCNLQGRHIVQFQYGGLLEEEGEGLYRAIQGSKAWPDAGEAVGILAATAVTEPAYQLKLDSPHILGAKAIGPLELINETLGSNMTVKSIDRRIQLRMPWGLKNRRYGQEKGATKIQQHLKPVTLYMLTVCTKIKYRKVEQGQGHSAELRRKSPWVGHIKLSVEKLKMYNVSVEELMLRLVKKHSNCLQFYASDAAASLKPCIHFFPNVLPVVATYNNQDYEDFMSAVLQTMRDIMLPILLRTTVKGDERILSVNIVWEDFAWNPISAKYPLGRHLYSRGNGELVVEVTVKDTCKTRGSAWDIVKEACIPIFQLLDWQRCTPYGIQEINHIFGLEAAQGVLQQRLGLAVAGMGKAVHFEHLKLIADSITISGSVNGAYMGGYKDLCTSLSSRRPFSNATFANCKNAFIQAAREGDMEQIEGALASSVWGKYAPLGTGSNFELLWQENVGQELLPTVSKGVDIHKHCEKLNSLLPPEPSSMMPIFDHEEEDMYVSGHPCISMQPLMKPPESKTSDKDAIRGVLGSRDLHRDISKSTQRPWLADVNDDGLTSIGGDIREEHVNSHQRFQLYGSDANGQKFEKVDSWRESRKSHRRPEQPNVQVASHSVSKHCPTQTPTVTFQVLHHSGEPIRETKITGIGLSKRSTSAVNLDQPSSSEPKCKRIVDHITQEVDVDLRPSNANTYASKWNHGSQTQPLSATNGHRRPISVPSKLPFNPRDDISGDSTPSFHTPKETLETHSASSSPCSSLREILGLAPVSDGNSSEGDQMSSISQPSFLISEKGVASISCATTQLARVNVIVEPKGVEACGSVSPLTESSSRRVSDEHVQHSSDTSKLMVSGDLLERQKAELNKEWKGLLDLASSVRNILHRRYQVGDRLRAPDQKFILDKVLYYHPDHAQKVGCGVHYIKVDHHQGHHTSRCFYVVRTDKTVCDFSYHKCMKGFANKMSPALAMQYDHEIMIKPHERGNPDLDLRDSPDLNFYPSWPSLSRHDPPGCDVGLPLSPKFPEVGSGLNSPVKETDHLELPINTCTGSRQKDESSCETSEPKTDI